jgi:signal transduction histidine kinase
VTMGLQAMGAIHHFESTDWPSILAVPLVVAFVAARGPASRGWLALGMGAFAIVAGAGIMASRGWGSWTNGLFSGGYFDTYAASGKWMAFFTLAVIGVVIVLLAWASGWAVHALGMLRVQERKQQVIEKQLEDSEVGLALAEERSRIAQEMHDVLAHSLAVIVAQADGARYLRSKRPAAVDGALTAIADAARGALVDVNGIIDGMLDGSAAPQPGLTDVDDLVAGVEAAGLVVTRTQAGEPGQLARGQELAVYRIVQEGLTNALRHRGRGSSVSVVFDWRGPGLSLQLVSSGEGEDVAVEPAGRPRRGIEGMRERARLAGGWLAAGSDENGDHRLTAFVPYRGTAAIVEAKAA